MRPTITRRHGMDFQTAFELSKLIEKKEPNLIVVDSGACVLKP
jgi:hypothetical protein